jgi:hypothetical protein
MEFSLSIQTGIQIIDFIIGYNDNKLSLPKYYFTFYDTRSLNSLCKDAYNELESIYYKKEYPSHFRFAMAIAREILELRIVVDPIKYFLFKGREAIIEKLLESYFLDIARFKGIDPFGNLEIPKSLDDRYDIKEQRINIQKERDKEPSSIEESFINFMIDSEIIILKNSPPEFKSVRELLERGAGVIIGTYVGLSIGDGNPLLLLISVPAGIIIGGAAVGLSRGLEIGLEKKIASFFQSKSHIK